MKPRFDIFDACQDSDSAHSYCGHPLTMDLSDQVAIAFITMFILVLIVLKSVIIFFVIFVNIFIVVVIVIMFLILILMSRKRKELV